MENSSHIKKIAGVGDGKFKPKFWIDDLLENAFGEKQKFLIQNFPGGVKAVSGSPSLTKKYMSASGFRQVKNMLPFLFKDKETNKQIFKKIHEMSGTIAGTIDGKRKKLILNRNVVGGPNLREVLRHEAFHRDNKVLGNSEILAHMYGKYNYKRNAPLLKKVVKSLGGIPHLGRTRPLRLAVELAAAAAPVVGGKAIYDKYDDGDKNMKKSND